MSNDNIGWFLAGLLTGIAGCLFAGLLVSCHPNEAARAKNAVDLAGYTQALDDCREEGKLAKSWEVYSACAKAADRKYGRRAD